MNWGGGAFVGNCIYGFELVYVEFFSNSDVYDGNIGFICGYIAWKCFSIGLWYVYLIV